MYLHRRLWTGIICALLISLLAACIYVPIPGRVLLSDPPEVPASSPAAAIETDGTRHFAWSEPSGIFGKNEIVYRRVPPTGLPHEIHLAPPTTSGDRYYDPILAVADNGDTYLAFRYCYTVNVIDTNCSGIYSFFSADWAGGPSSPLSAGVGGYDLRLVQRGGWVYVVGVTMIGDLINTSSSISYKQLSGSRQGTVVAAQENRLATSPSAIIDAAGNLHVAFQSHVFAGTDNKVGYTSNAGGLNDMPAPVYSTANPIAGQVSPPSLSQAGGNNAIFIAYSVTGSPSDSLYVWQPGTPVSWIMLPLGVDWQIAGSPVLVARGQGNYYIIFSASTSASLDTEIWTYDSTTITFTQITDDDVNDSQPVAVKTFGVAEYPVYGWRTTSDPFTSSACYGDVRVVTESQSPHPYLLTIFHDRGTCGNYGYGLAASGAKVLGVWLDTRPGSSFLELWYSVDGKEVFVPAVRK